ncbi:DNA ligase [Piptocephalis cylindrospora]|uniref:DNA ligase n=1 Tax=Piptocephalis cylindrospora TaxID=1907219 RepID=A0A4P9Y1L8_9FUNG|nr:DNA ligase [Piptocephalis cylindrospora]|eukprot:RKP12422.1 DNA ligase [Piptocephalis cylindrospora]
MKDIPEWGQGEDVPYAALCSVFEEIEGTTKRLAIQEHLTALFLRVLERTPNALVHIVYLCINRLAPEYEGVELGIGEQILMKSVASAYGRSLADVRADVHAYGDLGRVAELSRTRQTVMWKPKPLMVRGVFEALGRISQMSGKASQTDKVSAIRKLIQACKGVEARYLTRSLEGKLRIGLAEQTVLTALGHAALRHHALSRGDAVDAEGLAGAVERIKSMYNQLPSYDVLVPALVSEGLEGAEKICRLTAGIPVKPMLAHPTKSLTEVLDRFEGTTFTCEYKYDGERAQIHYTRPSQGGKDEGRGGTHIYSRNSEDMTGRYPDVAGRIESSAPEGTESFILDAEAVAWDRVKEEILPFQVLSTRKRKDVREEDISVQVCIFAFDLLYLNGQSLLQEPLSKRQALMRETFKEAPGTFVFTQSMETRSPELIQEFLDRSIQDHCEGLMIKVSQGEEATYEPSRRSRNWLKVKKDYLSGLGDSLDLVVVGAYMGKGKRVGGYGGYLLACYDPATEEYQTICKIGTGFRDEDLRTLHSTLSANTVLTKPSYYRHGGGENQVPDVWFRPTMIWEVKAADLSISPVYQAAVGFMDETKGISLRFPRFLGIREDKRSEDASTAEMVAEMYRKQLDKSG